VSGEHIKVLNVVGARPNFMKIGPIIDAIRVRSLGGERIDQFLVHTGQHYDRGLSALFFEQLGIPAPDVNLEVGSGSHAVQTAEIMTRFEAVCLQQRPSHVLVVGDVNSTIACALVAAKLGIRIVHVEAGLRSFDRSMPEEINRILTDAIADELFTTEKSANENLKHEGIPDSKVHFVGNVMIDSLLRHRRKAEESSILKDLGLAGGNRGATPYGVLTLHRAATVDDPDRLREILEAVVEVSKGLPVVFPVHPRTKSRITAFGFQDDFRWVEISSGLPKEDARGIIAVDPLGYLDFLRLMSCARLVLTDSGGIQEETTILGVPCVTLRGSTERPVTVEQGTNVLAGVSKRSILAHTQAQLDRPRAASPSIPPLWDGKAADRIVDHLIENVQGRGIQ
jgi:UDP-N-acetylglucosamine 2-epimerase (non-hydrolysing)